MPVVMSVHLLMWHKIFFLGHVITAITFQTITDEALDMV